EHNENIDCHHEKLWRGITMDEERPRDAGALLFENETFLIRAAVFEVSREMGAGFLEAVYQECLTLEFRKKGIAFEALPKLGLSYKGVALKQQYVPDFVCFGRVLVELKAVREIAPEHRAQVINYLRAT